jgi:hypothetical protein
VTENEKKVKAPAKSKKKAAERAGTKAEPIVKASAVAAEKKPRAKAVKTKEIAEAATAVASNGPQRVPGKVKAAPALVPTHQQIAQLAHRFWKERGGHHGSHEQDWLRAERELRGMAS